MKKKLSGNAYTEYCKEVDKLIDKRHEELDRQLLEIFSSKMEEVISPNSFLLKWKIKNKIRHYQRELNKIK